MTLEVGHDDHGIGVVRSSPDVHLRKMTPFYLNFYVIPSGKPVSNDQRSPNHRVIEPVHYRGLKVINRVRAASPVKGVGVGNEWLSSQGFYPVHYPPHILGSYVSQIALFPEVYLYRNQISGTYQLVKPGSFHKSIQFVEQTPVAGCPQIGEINLRSHPYTPPLVK